MVSCVSAWTDAPSLIPHEPQGQPTGIVEDFDGVRPSLKLSRSDSLARLNTHVRTDRSPYRGRRSEFISVLGNRGGERILASQDITPVAAISELEVLAWVKGNRTGFQIMIRVRLPRSRDSSGEPLSLYLLGDRYESVGNWQQLRVAHFDDQLTRQIRAMRANHNSAIDPTEAYVDQVVFNLFGGAEVNRFWLDDLSIRSGIPIQVESNDGQRNVTQASYARTVKVPEEEGLASIQIYRGQPISDIARQGFNTVWFTSTPTTEEVDAAMREQLRIICPPPSSPIPSDDASWIVAWSVPDDTSSATKNAIQSRDPSLRPIVSESLSAWPHSVASERWTNATSDKANRWIPVRNRLRLAVFQGASGFAFDPDKLATQEPIYRQSVAELFNLELSMLRPWIMRHESLERSVFTSRNAEFQITGMFSQHSGLVWFQPQQHSQGNEIDIPDALYREAYFVEPGSLEPARTRRITGGMRVSLNQQKPHGLLLVSSQPQVLRAHQEHLKSIGPRYNELLIKVIRHELIELDQQLTEKIDDQSFVGHLRKELHALHSRIAPILDDHQSVVTYRQLDHLLGQIERVQRLSDIQF